MKNLARYNKVGLVLIVIFVSFVSIPKNTEAAGWPTVGSAGFSSNTARYVSLKLDSTDTPYVAFQGDNGNKATVMKYNGSAWVDVGTHSISAGSVTYTSLAIDSADNLYVAYVDGANSNKATVMKWDGASWAVVGSAGFSAGTATYTSLVIDSSDNLYVAYIDGANSNKATVMKWDGVSWAAVGSAGFSASTIAVPAMAIDSSNNLYVVYDDPDNGDRLTVMKWDGVSWAAVGSAGFSTYTVDYPTIAIDSTGTPYVGYSGYSNGGKTSVMKWNGSSWLTVGTEGFTGQRSQYTSLAIDSSDTPYVGYYDTDYNLAAVMKYNGSSWGFVDGYISSSNTSYTSLAIDSSDTPYLAYSDSSESGKATVNKYSAADLPPEAHNVSVAPDRPLSVGTILTGHYTYFDWEDDSEGVSTFKWYRDDVAIPGATSSTYTMTLADEGASVEFEVTPVSVNAPTTGTPVRASVQVVTVNSLLDDGDGSCTEVKCTFRDALDNSVAGDTIVFSVTGTITLTDDGSPEINDNLTIIGPGKDLLTIDFDGYDFYINLLGGEFNISGLTFANDVDDPIYGDGANAINISDVRFTNTTGYTPVYINNESDVTTTVTDSEFINNSIDDDGGAIFVTRGDLIVNNTTFSGNISTGNGGAIYYDGGGTVTVTNSTFSGNSADNGGAIYNSSGTLHIINSTFSNNTSSGSGSDVYANDSVTIVNSILASDPDASCAEGSGAITSLGHNIDSGTSCGFDQTGDLSSTDPLLDTLADNGGPVETMGLLAGSPALDTADDNSAPATDARGITRPQGVHSDIGAFELEVSTPVRHHSSGGSVPLPSVLTISTPPLITPPVTTPPNLTASSTPTPPTCKITNTLKQGSKGDEVKCLQNILGNLTADGIFGPKTKAAVVLFQQGHSPLVPDGIVGPKTKVVLGL